MFVLGFFMSGVNNLAHAGGFIGGFAAGLVLSFSERRQEGPLERFIATALVGITALSFALALWNAFAG
jgi:membrane associated rhomboid family serine protease